MNWSILRAVTLLSCCWSSDHSGRLSYPVTPRQAEATPAASPSASPRQDDTSSANDTPAAESRETLVALVKGGRLVVFNSADSRTTFESLRLAASDHQPGPLEDEVIASTLRGRIASDEGLQKLKIRAESKAGVVRLAGRCQTVEQTAGLINLALSIEGVSVVTTELPASSPAATP